MRSDSPVAARFRRDHVLIASCVVLITALAWAYLVHLDRQMSSPAEQGTMAKMAMVMDSRWSTSDVAFTFVMWMVMMIAMMTPSAAPVLLLVAKARGPRTERGAPLAVAYFGLGYLTVWLGFSACAALIQSALRSAALLSSAMAASSPRLAGAILIAAGIYQLTPLKGGCLSQCQSPLGFLMSNWRDGNIGAFRMGFRHGTYCLGCCWALMCVLFAVGVMNLAWVGVLCAFVLLEKLGPTGIRVARAGGVVMVACGVLFIAK